MKYDVLVVGGGHAGCEAAWVASEFDIRVGILSMPDVPLASTPCNPAVGGVGKGQVVRELDALGGLMGRLADLSGIQFRVLNESKGAAVQSTRVQVDKDKYAQNAASCLAERPIDIIRDRVVSIQMESDDYKVLLSSGSTVLSKKIVITTGTFLNGRLHTG